MSQSTVIEKTFEYGTVAILVRDGNYMVRRWVYDGPLVDECRSLRDAKSLFDKYVELWVSRGWELA